MIGAISKKQKEEADAAAEEAADETPAEEEVPTNP
jgi:hypothetical protein